MGNAHLGLILVPFAYLAMRKRKAKRSLPVDSGVKYSLTAFDKLDPAMSENKKQMGKIEFESGNFISAIELIALAYRYNPDPLLFYSLGSSHRRQFEKSGDSEHRDMAIKRYQQYLSARPDGAWADAANNYLSDLEIR